MTTYVVHDFSGHPFQAQLSRHLAARGHTVEHLSAPQYVSGKGRLERAAGDSPSLTFAELELEPPFQKYAPWARARWEVAFGRTWVRRLRRQRPDAVVVCNVPLFALFVFARYARRTSLPFVFWHQDIYSFGLADEVGRRFPRPLARVLARILYALEAYVARNASQVVAIGPGFAEVYDEWGVDPSRVSVIPNWAPLDEIVPTPRDNRVSAELFPDDAALRLVYAGTIGRKHNPELLVDLVEGLRDRGVDAALAVVSEGDAADDLASSSAAATGLLRVAPFQPADLLPDVLGSGDVLVALLEPDATVFSIPSKVLSYLAAGRPVVALMPDDNPAATDVSAAGGFVASPDAEGLAAAVEWLTALADDRERVTLLGVRSRELAEHQFDIARVTTRFETILAAIAGLPFRRTRTPVRTLAPHTKRTRTRPERSRRERVSARRG